jgi:hypothetical protein
MIERIRNYNTTALQQEIRLPSVGGALAGREITGIQFRSKPFEPGPQMLSNGIIV